jgi:maleylpyruvate isomerase
MDEIKYDRKKFASHWIRRGLQAYEEIIKNTRGKFSIGDSITIADVFLVPQCFASLRFDI